MKITLGFSVQIMVGFIIIAEITGTMKEIVIYG